MGFRINTNIGALNAHSQAKNTNLRLDNSLQKLSSGLRINVAADDSSGMAIADSLNSQALGLGQSIANANDGIGVVQTADGALSEYINILNTVRTKAIQASSDGQNLSTRTMIQKDINALLEEAQNIAATTQFNGQTLLNGSFENKSFHIGAYSGETVKFNIGNTQIADVGKFSFSSGSAAVEANTASSITVTQSLNGRSIEVKVEDITFKALKGTTGATSLQQAQMVADEFNETSNKKGATVRASVTQIGTSANYTIRLDSKDTFEVADAANVGVTDAEYTATTANALNTINVTTRESAEMAVTITDHALREIGETRSGLGSAQNKLESTIRNISVTQVNVKSAESQIRDVDFASESANFNKQNILAQAGTYAMSQANAIQQNVMRLLQ